MNSLFFNSFLIAAEGSKDGIRVLSKLMAVGLTFELDIHLKWNFEI